MTINNINSTSSIDDLSQYLNNLNLQLAANTINGSERIDLIPLLENMLADIQGQTRSLEARVTILGDDAKELSQVKENLFSLKKINDTWGLVYHKCIQAQLSSLTKTCIDTSLAFASNPQQSPETTRKQYEAIKKIEHELTLLSLNLLLNEKEKSSIESFLSDARALLPLLEKQMNNDLDKALVVVGGPVVSYIQDPLELNIGQFAPCSNEILLNLLSLLSPEDLGNLTRCSKFFRDICEDNSVWQSILQKEFPSLSIPDNKSAKEIYISQKIEQSLINSLKNGLYTCSTLEKLFGNQTCFCIEGSRFFSGSYDNTIKVWDLTTNQCVATLTGQGHYFRKEKNRLISVSLDGSLKVLDLNASPEDTLLNLVDMIKETPGFVDLKALDTFKDRIKILPLVIRNEIYGALYEIQTFQNDYFGCAKHAFLGEHKLNCTVGKRVEAIHRYLLKEVIKLFKKGNSKKALDLFNKLPNEIKDRVSIFLNLSEQKIADDKKIEAIEKFLESTKVKR